MNTTITRMAAAVSLALLHISATAQEAKPAEAVPADGLNLERVVVTGTSTGSSKMKSSVSISTIEADTIQKSAPTSAAEVLRSVPGVRSESSGGEGNANITVRGVPISAGGARYVQIQEDGLPVLQSGDFNFITPDSYVKIDGSLDHLEVVRGGSASTMASNSHPLRRRLRRRDLGQDALLHRRLLPQRRRHPQDRADERAGRPAARQHHP
jgi:outer membrane receptor for ferrienterochelin and colicin